MQGEHTSRNKTKAGAVPGYSIHGAATRWSWSLSNSKHQCYFS